MITNTEVLITCDVFGRKKEVWVNQKCPVGTFYKFRNVQSVLCTNPKMSRRYSFTNSEMSRRYFVQIQKCPVGIFYKFRNAPPVLCTNTEISHRYSLQIQKCPVITLYKSRNIPSILFTNSETSHRYFVQIKIIVTMAQKSRMCKIKLIF